MRESKDYNVRIPQVQSIETAIRLYYERTELDNKDIQSLFGKLSSATITRLKRKARDKMIENNTPVWDSRRVNTAQAYSAWGMSIDDLERRYKKLKELSA